MMLRLAEDDAEMDRIAAQAIDGVGDHPRDRVLPDGLPEGGQLRALPEFCAGVHVAVDVRLVHRVALLRRVRAALLLLGHQGGALRLLAGGAHATVDCGPSVHKGLVSSWGLHHCPPAGSTIGVKTGKPLPGSSRDTRAWMVASRGGTVISGLSPASGGVGGSVCTTGPVLWIVTASQGVGVS